MHHPLDRALNELETDYGPAGEYEYGYEGDFESEGDYEYESDGEGEWGYETDPEAVFDEVEEMELAAALLEVSGDQEMEQFLGKLIRRVGKAAGNFIKSPVGKALGGALKGVARVALPAVGTALGGPVGGMLASTAGKMFGLELEGMSPQDQEFEAARRFVRLAGASAQNAARVRPGTPPTVAAKDAVLAAARKHAPGLVSGAAAGGAGGMQGSGGSRGQGGQSGRWIRKGDRLILFGA
ncbi:MAG TPA: hypothetical protein VGR37_09345 [Longimicrobiaceae bacterium]|nr:hypothetical protein [Longimicrobiaceae bacterium]